MRKERIRQMIGIVLSLVMVFQLCPWNALAAARESTQAEHETLPGQQSGQIMAEVPGLREEDVKHFRLTDGSYMAVSYGMRVHYTRDGQVWEDIDNTLTLTGGSGSEISTMSAATGGSYTAVNGDKTTSFAGSLAGGELFGAWNGQAGIRFSLPWEELSGPISTQEKLAQEPSQEPETAVSETVVESGEEPAQTEPEHSSQETVPQISETVPEEQETVPAETEQTAPTEDEELTTEVPGEPEETVPEETVPEETEPEETVPSETTEETLPPETTEETAPEETAPAETSGESVAGEETVTASGQPAFNRNAVAQISYPDQEGTAEDDTLAVMGIGTEETRQEKSLMEQAFPEKLRANVLYEDVYPGVDIAYELCGFDVKESIIVKEPLDSYSFTFRMSMDGLTPQLQDDGGIELLDESGQTLYAIPAPWMIDGAGELSEAVEYTLERESGELWLLTVEADAAWIDAEERVFPVTVDPTLVDKTTQASEFEGKAVGEYASSISSTTNVAVGYHPTYGKMETYFMPHFPSLPEGYSIVSAQAGFWQNDFLSYNGSTSGSLTVYMSYNIEPPSYSTMTWNTRPDRSEYMDYAVLSYDTIGLVLWDITRAVKLWHEEPSAVNGLAMTSDANSTTQCRAYFAYEKSVCSAIVYRDTVGIEPYYTYRTVGAGNAGTLYISDYSGYATVSKQLVSYAGAVNPVSIELNYSSAWQSTNVGKKLDYGMNVGVGFRLNIMQRIREVSIKNDLETDGTTTYLEYTDGDGTVHYFSKDPSRDANYYYDEDGLGLKITEHAEGNYTLSDDAGNSMNFAKGFLNRIKDANGNETWFLFEANSNGSPAESGDRIYRVVQKNTDESKIAVAEFTYDSANRISTVTDAAGTVYTLSYDEKDRLVSIRRTTPDGTVTTVAQYGYISESSVLSLYTNYAYDAEAGYGVAYKLNVDDRVTSYWEINSTSVTTKPGAIVNVSRSIFGWTKYRHLGEDRTAGTSDDIVTSYVFDYAGRSISADTTDASENILGVTSAVYSGVGTTDKDNNRTLQTATVGSVGVNKLSNGGFESTNDWSPTNASISSSVRRNGAKSLTTALTSTGTTATAQKSVSLTSGTTYTVSGYVNTSAATSGLSNGIWLEVVNSSGTRISRTNLVNYATSSSIDSGWIRVSDTFTVPSTGSYTVRIKNGGVVGSVYVDDVVLEEGEAPSNINLVDNGGFANGTTGWTTVGTVVTTEGITSGGQSKQALKLVGEPGAGRYASYTVNLNLPGTQTYVLSGWAKGYAVPDEPGFDFVREFNLRAKINYSDGTYENQAVALSSDVTGWQFASLVVVPDAAKTVTSIQCVCDFSNNVNYAYFDNISLVRVPAQTMKYNADGELISVATPGYTQEGYTYDGSDLIQAVTDGYGTFTYTYDDNHNLKTASNGKITQTNTWTADGNLTSTKLTGTGTTEYIQTSATYSDDCNRILTVTDARGKVTQYEYGNAMSEMLGVPTKTTDAKGAVYRTTFTDEGRVDTEVLNGLITLDYDYTKGRLTKVSRSVGLQSYILSYDDMGRLTTVSVGSGSGINRLVQNTYSVLGDLLSQTYGNGDAVSYTYDDLGRVKTMTEDDGTVTTYYYSTEGYLSMVESGGVTYRYVYDALGRLISSDMGTDTSTTLQTYHEYDSSNRLSKQTLNLLDKTYSSSYTYNSYGLLTKLAQDDASISLTYDNLQRLSRTSNSVYKVAYTYTDGAATNATTGLVSKMAYSDSAILEALQTFEAFDLSYTYDNLGNIASVTDSRDAGVSVEYEYDPQGQLLKVTQVEGTAQTVVGSYTYDNGGNILTATGSDGITHTYEYGNANWKDLLTKYDGQTITYDTIGNPTSYYNGTRWSFTWSNGRQLTQASDADDSVSATYAYDMNGLRTSKTVNGVTHNYIYAGGKLIRETYGSTVMDFLYDQNGKPFGFYYNGTLYYYILNLQGDVIGLCNSAGTMIARYSYDAWGNVTVSATSSTNLTRANANPLRYRGYYYDTETGFYYLQSRYYDPAICRFINADQFVSTGQGFIGYNMFAYCNNNPVNNFDPSGQIMAVRSHEMISSGGGAIGSGGDIFSVIVVAAVSAGTAVLSAIEEAAEEIKMWAQTVEETMERKDQSVYVLCDPNNNDMIMYVGRTNDPVRREKEHKTDPRHPERAAYEMKVVATGLNIPQSKLLEQALISAFTIDYLDNARREIAVRNLPNFNQYIGAVSSIWEGATEESLFALMGG